MRQLFFCAVILLLSFTFTLNVGMIVLGVPAKQGALTMINGLNLAVIAVCVYFVTTRKKK